MTHRVVDSHVHFWDPTRLEFPWLEEHAALQSPFLPADYDRAMDGIEIEGIIFVEGNPRPDQALEEVRFIEELAAADSRIEGIVAYVDLFSEGLGATLDELSGRPLVRGVRHNIQGNPPGFAVRPEFVDGVRETGRRGLTFDLCATHDQLLDVISLASEAGETRLVLDHCAKPAIRKRHWEPWASQIGELADLPHVWCKVSGLLTEADLRHWQGDDILRYAEHVFDCFGPDRVMYGSDWPVMTLADRSRDWFGLTRALTVELNDEERRGFYGENARLFYRTGAYREES